MFRFTINFPELECVPESQRQILLERCQGSRPMQLFRLWSVRCFTWGGMVFLLPLFFVGPWLAESVIVLLCYVGAACLYCLIATVFRLRLEIWYLHRLLQQEIAQNSQGSDCPSR